MARAKRKGFGFLELMLSIVLVALLARGDPETTVGERVHTSEEWMFTTGAVAPESPVLERIRDLARLARKSQWGTLPGSRRSRDPKARTRVTIQSVPYRLATVLSLTFAAAPSSACCRSLTAEIPGSTSLLAQLGAWALGFAILLGGCVLAVMLLANRQPSAATSMVLTTLVGAPVSFVMFSNAPGIFPVVLPCLLFAFIHRWRSWASSSR